MFTREAIVADRLRRRLRSGESALQVSHCQTLRPVFEIDTIRLRRLTPGIDRGRATIDCDELEPAFPKPIFPSSTERLREILRARNVGDWLVEFHQDLGH